MIQTGRAHHLGVLLVALMVFYLGMGGCDESPTKAAPVDGSDYVVYLIGGQTFSTVYGYHPADGSIESWEVPGAASLSVDVSPNGALAYFGGPTTTVVRTTNTFDMLTELPYSGKGGVAVSPNNQYVALLGDETYILRASDYSVYYHDTNEVHAGLFSHDGSVFYAVGTINDGEIDQRSYVVTLSMEQPAVVSYTEMPYHRLDKVMPSDDGDTWLLSQSGFFTKAVDVYHVPSDSVIYSMRVHPQSAVDFERSKDGRYLFFTYPCPWSENIGVCDPPGRITAFDLTTGDVAGNIVIPVSDTVDPYTSGANVGPLSITPDGRWLIGAAGDYIVKVDAVAMEVVDNIFVENAALFFQTACQASQ